MSTPNPKAFARQVLWALAGLQAQMAEIEALLVSEKCGNDPEAIQKATALASQRRLEKQQKLFRHLAVEVGVDEPHTDGSPPPNPSQG